MVGQKVLALLSCSVQNVKFSGIFLLSAVAVLYAALLFCFQVPRFMCYLLVNYPTPFSSKFSKGYQAPGLLSLMSAVLIQSREKILCWNIFFNAHTLTRQKIVVGDMLKRNDIMFRPTTGKPRLAG